MYRLCPLIGLLILVVAPAQSALAANTAQLMDAAIEHYDQGDFDTAISLLEEVLDQEPRNGMAAYELGLSHQAKGDFQSCAKVTKRYVRRLKDDPKQKGLLPQLSMLQASCHSAAGDAKKALRVFREAIKRNPDDYGLNFNIAITLLNEGEYVEAIQHLETAIRAEPSNPSPYYVVGIAYQDLGRSVEGLLAYLSFLQREFNTPRCVTAAQAVIDIAYSRVKLDESGGATTIQLSPSLQSEAPEILTLTLALTLSAVASMQDGEIEEPVIESISELLTRFISISAAMDPESDSFFTSYILSGVLRLEEAELTSAFSYYLLSVAGIDGAGDWLNSHSEETDRLVEYFELLANVGLPVE